MSMIRWESFPESMSLRQALDRMWEESFARPMRPGEASMPAVDMYQTPTQLVVKVSVPGVKAEDLDVHVSGDGLTVKGERREAKETKREDYYYQEQRYGSFVRHISLPSGIAVDRADAHLDDGILTLTIPKVEGTKAKAVKVRQAKPAEPKKVVAKEKKASK